MAASSHPYETLRRIAGALITVVLSASGATGHTRPNLVVILADDMGLGDVSAYNPAPGSIPADRTQAETPNIDALAANGIRFTNAHTPSAVCTPTRHGLLTGRHPNRAARHGGGFQNLGIEFDYSDIFLREEDGRAIADVLGDGG